MSIAALCQNGGRWTTRYFAGTVGQLSNESRASSVYDLFQFPDGFQAPANPGRYRLEVAVVTVPRAGFHYIHVIKFQVDHQNRDTPDENPRYIELTAEDFQKGRIT